MGRRGGDAVQSRLISLQWRTTHKRENNYNCRGSPHGVRGLSHILGSPVQGFYARKTLKGLALKASGAYFSETQRDAGRKDCTLKEDTQNLTHARTQEISSNCLYQKEPVSDPLADLGELPREAKDNWSSSVGIQTLVTAIFRSLFYHVCTDAGKCCLESSLWLITLRTQLHPCLPVHGHKECLRPDNKLSRDIAPSTRRQAAPLNPQLSLDMALPTRQPRIRLHTTVHRLQIWNPQGSVVRDIWMQLYPSVGKYQPQENYIPIVCGPSPPTNSPVSDLGLSKPWFCPPASLLQPQDQLYPPCVDTSSRTDTDLYVA